MAEKILHKLTIVNSRDKALAIGKFIKDKYDIICNEKIIGPNTYEVTCQCDPLCAEVKYLKDIAEAIVFGWNARKKP